MMEEIGQGKTKIIYKASERLVRVVSKDILSSGNGARTHTLPGKAAVSNKTNTKIFELLNYAGIRTAFIQEENDTSFTAKYCDMIPIEWVVRRIATGSYTERHRGVVEGFRFSPPLLETFFKDDAKNDPFWTDEDILGAGFSLDGLVLKKPELDILKKTALCVFEILEKLWAIKNCVLVDLKMEFGVDPEGKLVLADVIDSDSWRLWPEGDKDKMKDKQVYRNLKCVTPDDLKVVLDNFTWTLNKLERLPTSNNLVVIVMGSCKDEGYARQIACSCTSYRLTCEYRVCSAHKAPDDISKLISDYEDDEDRKIVFIAVAGRSNGLGPTLAANTIYPVINCPPLHNDNVERCIWSSLELPSGVGCATAMYPESAALAAAHIHSLHDFHVWVKLNALRLNNFVISKEDDKFFQGIV